MTIEEIFSEIAQHMVEGLMFHSQMSDYYYFLGLKGYGKCHEYHYFEENSNYKKISRYYMKHYNKLILESPFKNPNVIPENWYKFTKQDVDSSVRKASIKAGFEAWIKWEKDTKLLFEKHYKNLVSLNEIAAAIELKNYIEDVSEELANAEYMNLTLKAIDYNISDIIMAQEDKYKKYKNKIKEIQLI